MMAKVDSTDDFKLNTEKFSAAAHTAKELAEKLEDVHKECDKNIDTAYFSWAGKGRNEFEKKYHIFEQQFTDLKNSLWDIYESIVAAESSYIQGDVDSAKQLDGKTERYSQ